MPIAPFSLSEIIIIQALQPDEEPTGKIVHDYVESLLQDCESEIGISLVQTASPDQFIAFVSSLVTLAASGAIPLLHVECLYFPDGNSLSWDDLYHVLEPLNRATRFNLVAVFSACHGAHSVGQIGAIDPAPFYFMIGPTSEVSPPEIMRGMFDFYRVLVQTSDLGLACAALQSTTLDAGSWFCTAAQGWFVEIVAGYLEEHCTEEATHKRISELRRLLLARGKDVGTGRLRRQLRELNSARLVDHFETFFMVDDLPENALRFEAAKTEIERYASDLRRVGRHVV